MKEEYGLRVLAYTVDYGFMPNKIVKQNIERVVEKTGVDYISVALPSDRNYSGHLTLF